MEVPPEMLGTLFFEANQFSSFHVPDENGRDVLQQALAMADVHDVDDQTKIIAEGARWQAVRNKAIAGGLTDQSRFYPAANHAGPWQPDDQVPYVTLADL